MVPDGLGSTNGTLVNGERIFAPRTLCHGDEILVGRTRLVLRDPAARADVTTAPLRAAPPRTPGEQRVLVELCRPVLSGQAFTPPSSVRAIADALYVSESAVKQHLERLYDKFAIREQRAQLATRSCWPTRSSRAAPSRSRTSTRTPTRRDLTRQDSRS